MFLLLNNFDKITENCMFLYSTCIFFGNTYKMIYTLTTRTTKKKEDSKHYKIVNKNKTIHDIWVKKWNKKYNVIVFATWIKKK